MTLRTILMALCCLVGLTATAQNDDEWRDGRPECDVHFTYNGEANRGVRRVGSQATAPLRSHGAPHVPVVLVAFSDLPFMSAPDSASVNQFYHLFCNGTMDGKRYTGHGSYGSIRDYFIEQSDSAFRPEFDVIGPVTLDSTVAYYGQNGSSRDVNYGIFTRESITKAMAAYNDWSRFDNDGNNTVDMIFFIFAGFGESNTKQQHPELLWPKESTASTKINDVVFATTGITCECRPKWSGKEIVDTLTDGVGVFIHELSHALGLPDFYDTNYKAFGMDLWSVMDYGEYGGNGYTPGNYTAYERDFMGWRKLVTLTEPCVLTIPCFADGGTGYKIINDANPNEYYVIENRQPKGWDSAVGQSGHGLQVTHVDYYANNWTSNTVNTDSKHQLMTIIPANNSYNGVNTASSSAEWRQTLAGQLYPGDTYNWCLTDESTPAAEVFSNSVVYTGALMHKPLNAIIENADGTVTVYFMTDADAIKSVGNEHSSTIKAVYDMSGRRVARLTNTNAPRGIYIVKYADGSVRKVLH